MMSLRRRMFLAAAALPLSAVLAPTALIPVALVPVTLVPAVPVRAQEARAAVSAPIVALNQGLIAAMRAGRQTPFRQRFQALAPVVENAFDLSAVLQSAVGLRWRSLPADQQQRLLAAFREFTVATYVANFDEYNGERIEMLPDIRSVGAQQVVATRIVPANGDPTRLDYVMRQEGGGWKAVDVLLDGSISRAAVMRSDFRTLLASGSAEPLIENLQRKAADLSARTQH